MVFPGFGARVPIRRIFKSKSASEFISSSRESFLVDLLLCQLFFSRENQDWHMVASDTSGRAFDLGFVEMVSLEGYYSGES